MFHRLSQKERKYPIRAQPASYDGDEQVSSVEYDDKRCQEEVDSEADLSNSEGDLDKKMNEAFEYGSIDSTTQVRLLRIVKVTRSTTLVRSRPVVECVTFEFFNLQSTPMMHLYVELISHSII